MRRPPPIVVAVLLLTATSAAAAIQPPNWSLVRQLAAGLEVRVAADPGVVHLGVFDSADDLSLSLRVNGQAQRVDRASVREVAVAGRSRKKNVLWGLVIGVAASVAVVSLQCRGESEACQEGAPQWFYPLTGAGVGIGALLPPRQVWRQIYVRTR